MRFAPSERRIETSSQNCVFPWSTKQVSVAGKLYV
jgi:hypothetical protein